MRVRASLIAAAAAALVAVGCRDSGLPDRNLALEDARHRAPDALVQAVHPETNPALHGAAAEAHGAGMTSGPVTVGGQTFQAAGRPIALGDASLRSVGTSAMGGTFSAAAWDEPPYDRLYLAHPGGTYLEYLPVHESGDPASRLEAGRRTLEGGAPAAH